jgi:hypothetical protein
MQLLSNARPEFAESTYMLFKATGDVRYLEAGRDMVRTLQAKYVERTDVDADSRPLWRRACIATDLGVERSPGLWRIWNLQ